MSDGVHHHNVWKAGWLVIVPSTLYVATYNIPLATGMVVGYGLGGILTPDADLVGTTSEEGRAMRILPGPIGWVWVGYWTIYGAAFRRLHRSVWTHLPFLSTAIRLVYLLWWLYFVPLVWEQWHVSVLLGLWVALSGADLGHYTSDILHNRRKNTHRTLRKNSKNRIE